MQYTSKGAQLLRTATTKTSGEPGAKWTPETGWTDQELKARSEYEAWRHKQPRDTDTLAEEAGHAEAMSRTSNQH